jgi:hypothetical protein
MAMEEFEGIGKLFLQDTEHLGCHIMKVRGQPKLFDDNRGPDSPVNSLKTIPLEFLNPLRPRFK